jgi:Tfp pilus assembly protein PilV
MMNTVDRSCRSASARAAMSLTEVALAMAILALAMLPVFGLITGGLARTDIATGMTAAAQLASSIMNRLLSDSFSFANLPISPAGRYRDPQGSVAADTRLNPIFDEAGWTTSGNSRLITQDTISYQVYLWIGTFARDTDLSFRYLQSPDVRYTDATPNTMYMPLLRLQSSHWDYSPYNPANAHVDAAWASQVVSKSQWEVAAGTGTIAHDANQNFAKIVLQIAWFPHHASNRGLGDNQKNFWLVSFRANVGSQ